MTTNWLVDTNVLSELARPIPDPAVVEWARSVSRTALSSVSVEEIYFGLSWKPKPKVLAWFQVFLREHCEVLVVSDAVARRAGELRGQLRAAGIVRTQADMLIAATARVHALTLVTRNEKDFEGCAIGLLNPFSQPS
jgi:predicted nucleic acid-binding protein